MLKFLNRMAGVCLVGTLCVRVRVRLDPVPRARAYKSSASTTPLTRSLRRKPWKFFITVTSQKTRVPGLTINI